MPSLAHLVHLSPRVRLTKVPRGIPSMSKSSAHRRFSPVQAVTPILFFLLALSAGAPSAAAQSPASSMPAAHPAGAQAPAAQNPSDAQKPDEDQGPAGTVKVSVNVVGLFFNVKDKHGALMPNLTKDDFEVLEDAKPQTIKYFAAESNLPLTL